MRTSVLAVLVLAAVAFADEPDFTKKPSQVKGYDKVRFSVKRLDEPKADEKDKAKPPVFEVTGKAFYPDGVILQLQVRHAKLRESFARAQAVVKDHAFTVRFGPFAKGVAGGDLCFETWFLLQSQKQEMKALLAKESFFCCSPPCSVDQMSVVRVEVPNGGPEAQMKAEAEEKAELERARAALVEARRASAGKEGAAAQLEQDGATILQGFEAWRAKRAFVLFPQAANRLARMKQDMVEAERAATAEARAKAAESFQKASDELRGLGAEKDSLDKAWSAWLREVEQRMKAADCTPAKVEPNK